MQRSYQTIQPFKKEEILKAQDPFQASENLQSLYLGEQIRLHWYMTISAVVAIERLIWNLNSFLACHAISEMSVCEFVAVLSFLDAWIQNLACWHERCAAVISEAFRTVQGPNSDRAPWR